MTFVRFFRAVSVIESSSRDETNSEPLRSKVDSVERLSFGIRLFVGSTVPVPRRAHRTTRTDADFDVTSRGCRCRGTRLRRTRRRVVGVVFVATHYDSVDTPTDSGAGATRFRFSGGRPLAGASFCLFRETRDQC